MIQHHPDDDLLLGLAAGQLAAGPALVLRVHLEGCPQCRARVHTLEALGGVLLEEGEPHLLAPDALARTLERIDALAAVQAPPAPAPRRRPALPDGVAWPAVLARAEISSWRWMGPGMRFSRVRLPQSPEAALFLLKIGPGRSLPRHTHAGKELTQVLCGAFDDGRAVFAAGDFDAADGDVHHQPVVKAGAECVCLASVDGGLRFDGAIASTIGGWIGL